MAITYKGRFDAVQIFYQLVYITMQVNKHMYDFDQSLHG